MIEPVSRVNAVFGQMYAMCICAAEAAGHRSARRQSLYRTRWMLKLIPIRVVNLAVTPQSASLRSSARIWGGILALSVTIIANQVSKSVEQHGIYVGGRRDQPFINGNVRWGNRGCGIHLNNDLSQRGDGIISEALGVEAGTGL
jgi:hypothetical protein